MTKEPTTNRKDNCFHLIRLLAALQVFLGHAFTHLQVAMPRALSAAAGCFSGVPIFFGLSGFLLWDSIARTKDLRQYAKKRLLRLYPELWGGVLVNLVLMLVLYRDAIHWGQFLLFQGTQATVFQFWTPECLRGYGCGTPNGSLWTVGVMVQCYLVLWLLYKVLHRTSFRRWGIALALSMGMNVAKQFSGAVLPELADKLFGQTFLPYLWMFLLGGMAAEYFEKMIDGLKKYWWLLFLAAQLVRITGFDLGRYGTLHVTLLILSVIGFAYRLPMLRIKIDVSYGLYIYHMIVINAMIELGDTGKGIDVWIALLLSCALALASYYTVGAAGRRLKARK